MAANVETMMYVREKPWHGLGVEVSEAPNSEDALRFAGLDWNVRQENVFNSRGGVIKGFKANVRDSDDSVLGVVEYSARDCAPQPLKLSIHSGGIEHPCRCR